MKNKITIFIATLICILFFFKFADVVISKTEINSEMEAPNFAYKEIYTGETGQIIDFKGKVIIINFWASWCRHCVEEIKDLIEISKENQNNLVLLMISQDRTLSGAREFMKNFYKKNGLEFDQKNVFYVWDENKEISHKIFQTMRYPETIIISPDFKIVQKLVGKVSKSKIQNLILPYF